MSVALIVWCGAVLAGSLAMLNYGVAPGSQAPAPLRWPAGSHIERMPDEFTLVMFAHPNCPCSLASLEELNRIATHAPFDVSIFIVVTVPPGLPSGWESAELMRTARAIERFNLIVDIHGAEAQRFGIETSGHVVLYGADGRLLFSGGITPSRGHEGDNDGKQSVIESLNRMQPALDNTPVYGCPLFDRACGGDHSCPQ